MKTNKLVEKSTKRLKIKKFCVFLIHQIDFETNGTPW